MCFALCGIFMAGLVMPDDADAQRGRKKKTDKKTFNVEELCNRQYASGLEFKKNSRFVDAKDAFNTVIEACPEYRKAFVQLGNLALQLRDWDEAVKNYEKALELDDDDMEAKEALAFAYQSSGRNDEAVDIFAGILEQDPTRISAIQYMAVAYEQDGKKTEAFNLYQQAFQIDQTIEGLEEKLTNLSLDMKQWEQAYLFTRRQVDRAPDNVGLKRKLAFFHYKAEDWDTAVELYQALTADHPDDPGTLGDYQLLGYCLRQAGRVEDAFPVYEYIIEKDESPEENTYYFYAIALMDSGRLTEAIRIADKGLAVDGSWGCLAYTKGEALSKRGDSRAEQKNWEGARGDYKSAKAAFAGVASASRCFDSSIAQQDRQDQLLDRLNKLEAKAAQSGE